MTTLSNMMDFDHVIEVHADYTITDCPGVYGPSLYWDGDTHYLDGDGWELINGYSRQDRYAGPIMHESELIAGGIADEIRGNPGVYVALVCYVLDEDDVAGWAIARKL